MRSICFISICETILITHMTLADHGLPVPFFNADVRNFIISATCSLSYCRFFRALRLPCSAIRSSQCSLSSYRLYCHSHSLISRLCFKRKCISQAFYAAYDITQPVSCGIFALKYMQHISYLSPRILITIFLSSPMPFSDAANVKRSFHITS